MPLKLQKRKMDFTGYFRYRALLLRTRPKRYAHLFRAIYDNRCRRIVEIGTWDGIHALQMIQTAAIHTSPKNIDYFGFDLFEDLTEEKLKKEFSKMSSTYENVKKRLESTGANIRLYKGDTKITLPAAVKEIGRADFVFIDGGHSIETISSDWKYTQQIVDLNSLVVFDDYYVNNDNEIDGLGCQTLVRQLDPLAYEVRILNPTDNFVKEWGILQINMASVRRKSLLKESRA